MLPGQNWIDISKISPEGEYLDSAGSIYRSLTDYIIDLSENRHRIFQSCCISTCFRKIPFPVRELCLVLYEQGILSKDDGMYDSLWLPDAMGAYDFMVSKISTLEIEPAQLALEPCSASAVTHRCKNRRCAGLCFLSGL